LTKCDDLKLESSEPKPARMQMISLFLVISSVLAESTPGTETILLVRGGYGPGVNLFSSGSETHRHLKSANKAPVDRTSSEKNELAKLSNVSLTASLLNTQLQTAIKSTYSALQESEQVRVDDANLKEKLALDERKIQQGADAEKARAQLQAEVQALQAQLAAEKAKTAAEHKRGLALQAKAASLENDIRVISRSWKEAAQHQANLVKQAQTQSSPKKAVAKSAPASVAKAQVQKKAVKKVVKKVVAVKKAVPLQKVAVQKDFDDDEESDSDDSSDDSQEDDDDSADDDSADDN